MSPNSTGRDESTPPHRPSGALRSRRSLRLKGYDYRETGAYFITIVTRGRQSLFGEIVDGEIRLNDLGRIVEQEWLKTTRVRTNIVLDEFVVMPNHLHGILTIAGDPVGANRRLAPTANRPSAPTANRPSAPTANRPSAPTANRPSAPTANTDLASTAKPNLAPTANPSRATTNVDRAAAANPPPVPTAVAFLRAPASNSIGAIMAQFKSCVTKRINAICDLGGSSVWQRNYYEHIIRSDADLDRIRAYIIANPSRWDSDDENPTH